MKKPHSTRRSKWFDLAQRLAGPLAMAGLPRYTGVEVRNESGLIIRSESPEQLETPLEVLGHDAITPNEAFFVRSHFDTPSIDPWTWRLHVSGLVRQPLSLSFEVLDSLPATEVTHTLECAGNGRSNYRHEMPNETPWGVGAVGTARWGGVLLADVLEQIGLQPEARHVWFEAADRSDDPGKPPFIRSIPLEKAMDDVLLVHTMNGAPLPASHGAPLRVIVPGWYGMASTKWLTGLRIEAKPSDNHFQANAYHLRYKDLDAHLAPPVDIMRIKSLITSPRPRALVKRGRLRVTGFAWDGPHGVRRVEVSTDGARTWQPAALLEETEGRAWRRWFIDLDLEPGSLTLMARATDRSGAAQPLEAWPNANGYANNSIHRVSIDVLG
jgi:sulfite oxidase